MNIALYVWTFLAILRFNPPEVVPQFPGHEETEPELLQRYGALAEAIVAECDGSSAPRSCAALLVAIGTGESRFARDADVGPCWRGTGHRARCGGGRAASVWQVEAPPGTTRAELFSDRRLAARLSLRAARWSLAACRHLPPADRLAGLSGTCHPATHLLESARARMRMWGAVEAWHPKGTSL